MFHCETCGKFLFFDYECGACRDAYIDKKRKAHTFVLNEKVLLSHNSDFYQGKREVTVIDKDEKIVGGFGDYSACPIYQIRFKDGNTAWAEAECLHKMEAKCSKSI